MFFADPTAAFANIRRALRPGGRLAAVTWRAVAENPLFSAPAQAAAELIELPPPADPAAPGLFRYADRASAVQAFSDAGFSDVVATPVDSTVGTTDLEDALVLALRFGPLGAALRATPQLTDTVRPAARAALERYLTSEGIRIPAAVWVLTARA